MTVFEAVIDMLRTADAWPEELYAEASIEEAKEHILPRLAELGPLPAPFGFRHSDHDSYRYHMTFATAPA